MTENQVEKNVNLDPVMNGKHSPQFISAIPVQPWYPQLSNAKETEWNQKERDWAEKERRWNLDREGLQDKVKRLEEELIQKESRIKELEGKLAAIKKLAE